MIILQLIFFSLLTIASLYCILRIFIGKKVLEVNAELGTCPIEITESGFYSLWLKGKMFKKTGIDVRQTKITDKDGKKKSSIPAIFKPKANGISQATIVLRNYFLKKGFSKNSKMNVI